MTKRDKKLALRLYASDTAVSWVATTNLRLSCRGIKDSGDGR